MGNEKAHEKASEKARGLFHDPDLAAEDSGKGNDDTVDHVTGIRWIVPISRSIPDFALSPGESSQSYEASPAVAGRLMVMGSHLHELATKIVCEDVTEEKVLWEGFPITDDGNLAGVTIGRLYRRFGSKIFPDHTYRVTVHYNNTTGETITDGGMGVVAGVFMPAMGEQWPAVNTDDPLYALDRAHYMREVRGKHDVMRDGGGKVASETMDHQHNPGN